MSVRQRLAELYSQLAEQSQQKAGKFPVIEHDAAWPSPCEIAGSIEEGLVQWQGVAVDNQSLSPLADALEITLPEGVDELFSSHYGNNLTLAFDTKRVYLLQAWNQDDYERLQQNITGHVLMKRQLKQADTIFFAVTDEDDLLIVINVADGSVWLEYVGKVPHFKLAENVLEFLTRCQLSEVQ